MPAACHRTQRTTTPQKTATRPCRSRWPGELRRIRLHRRRNAVLVAGLMSQTRRVVVTGMGVITPIGNDVTTFWNNLTAGVSGVGPITHFDVSAFDCRIAAQVVDFDPARYFK